MKSLITFSFLIFFTFSLQAQCPELIDTISSDGLTNNKLVLKFDTGFTPDSSANITLDFGTADFRTGYYPVNIVNGDKWETESQGDNFFTGDLNSLITTNGNFCNFTDGQLEESEERCTQWNGNCTTTETIWREGNVGVGMEPVGAGPNESDSYKVSIRGSLPPVGGGTIPDPGSSTYGLYVESSIAMRVLGASFFEGIIVPQSISLGSNDGDNFSFYKSSPEVLTITGSGNINFDFHEDGTFSSLEIEADEVNAKNLTIDEHIQTETITVNDLIETEHLYVMEHLHAKALTIKLPPFPDYVFELDYDMMPLKELEKYIQKHKHLPNIPSAVEVEKNGINVGEFEVKQMEKIEELTLYIIDINKRLEKIEKENKKLKAQIKNK